MDDELFNNRSLSICTGFWLTGEAVFNKNRQPLFLTLEDPRDFSAFLNDATILLIGN